MTALFCGLNLYIGRPVPTALPSAIDRGGGPFSIVNLISRLMVSDFADGSPTLMRIIGWLAAGLDFGYHGLLSAPAGAPR